MLLTKCNSRLSSIFCCNKPDNLDVSDLVPSLRNVIPLNYYVLRYSTTDTLLYIVETRREALSERSNSLLNKNSSSQSSLRTHFLWKSVCMQHCIRCSTFTIQVPSKKMYIMERDNEVEVYVTQCVFLLTAKFLGV